MHDPQDSRAGRAFEVRPLAASDLPRLRELFLQVRRQTFVWQDPALFQIDDFDAATQGEQIWVARAHGVCIGFIALWEPDRFIHHLYIDAAWTRQGVGRALLAALPGWPATRYQLKCLTRNQRALAFYRACGFVALEQGRAEGGDYLLLRSGVAA